MDDLIFTNDRDGLEQMRFVAHDDGVEIDPFNSPQCATNREDATFISKNEVIELRDWLDKWLEKNRA